MLAQLGHEALAEAHDFHIALALGIEVGTAFAAAHGQGGQAVLEDLFKAQEFDYRSADTGVQTQAAFVGADCRVELAAETAVHLHLAVVIHPGNPELDEPFGLYQAFDHAVLFVAGIFLHYQLQGFQHFFHSLQKFAFAGISALDLLHDTLHVAVCNCHR